MASQRLQQVEQNVDTVRLPVPKDAPHTEVSGISHPDSPTCLPNSRITIPSHNDQSVLSSKESRHAFSDENLTYRRMEDLISLSQLELWTSKVCSPNTLSLSRRYTRPRRYRSPLSKGRKRFDNCSRETDAPWSMEQADEAA